MTEIDARLLERARAGDRQAHAALYRAFAPMVYTVARRMLGSRALAEDVLQDCFVEVIRNAAQFRGESGIGGWIRQIAVNKALSQLRSPWWRRRVRPAGADMQGEDRLDGEWSRPDALEAGTPGDETAVAGQAVSRSDLAAALDALPATSRAVVWLHAVEGYTHQEIGRMMGRSTSFSKSQFARSREQLRRLLEPEDADAESDACLGILKTV